MTYLEGLFTQPVGSMTIIDIAALLGIIAAVFFGLLFIYAVVENA